MDFNSTREQILLRDTTRDLLPRSYDAEKRIQIVDTELGWSREVWGKLAEMGILGLAFDRGGRRDGRRTDRGRRGADRGRPTARPRADRRAALAPVG